MATTIPPVHNYESQIVFSNQSNNIKSTDVINWTIAPSGDDVYFNLYKSRMTFKLKITGLANNGTGADKILYVPVKKNMSGIVNNTKVTYTYWNGENLASLPLSADNENIGQIRSLLNALTDNKHTSTVNEGLKELSYVYYDGRDYDGDTDETERAAANMGRPYGLQHAQVYPAKQFDHGIHHHQCELCGHLRRMFPGTIHQSHADGCPDLSHQR